jgi:hypothetical protein
MKKLLLFSLILTSFNFLGVCQQKQKKLSNQKNKIQVYYFHGTRRCSGCINAEKAAVNALNALYKKELDKGIIKFESINIEEDKNKNLLKNTK